MTVSASSVFGGLPAWVLPGGGERARLAVLDRLLDSSAVWNEAQRSVSFLPRQTFPAGAQVIAVSGLHDERMTIAIADLARRGHDTSVVVVDEREAGRPDVAQTIVLARRLWRLELRRARRELERLGIPVVSMVGNDPAQILRSGESASPPDSAVVVMTTRLLVRWGATVGATAAGALIVVLAASAASADGRRGAVVFGIAGVLLLIAWGSCSGAACIPAGLVAIGVSFAFSLAGHQVESAEVMRPADRAVAARRPARSVGIRRGDRSGRARTAYQRGSVSASDRTRRARRGRSALVLSAGDLPVPGGLAAEAIGIAGPSVCSRLPRHVVGSAEACRLARGSHGATCGHIVRFDEFTASRRARSIPRPA